MRQKRLPHLFRRHIGDALALEHVLSTVDTRTSIRCDLLLYRRLRNLRDAHHSLDVEVGERGGEFVAQRGGLGRWHNSLLGATARTNDAASYRSGRSTGCGTDASRTRDLGEHLAKLTHATANLANTGCGCLTALLRHLGDRLFRGTRDRPGDGAAPD